MNALRPQSRRAAAAKRLLLADDARTDLLDYTRFTMPDYTDPSPNPKSIYMTGRHHEYLARVLHDVARGKRKRVIINMGPRHGKTELASKRFIAWWSAQFPHKSLIFGTYNETFAGDTGRAVRDIINQPEHRLVFPQHRLKDGSQAAQRLETLQNGVISFVGRGGTITGRGGHGLIIDDPIKDRTEADSPTTRDKLWTWFTQVVGTRMMDDNAWILLIQTRWHEDDLVGRLLDPINPFYSPQEAKQWHVIDFPAIAFDDDILGRKPGQALWPERFNLKFLKDMRRRDPRGFQALYQGRPTAEEGTFFLREWIKTYRTRDLPRNLRIYAASDHAVSTLQYRDKTALILAGLDDDENLYILPQTDWRKMDSNTTVESMITLMRNHKPMFWWAERGQISKALGPFLRKRMHEEHVYCPLIEVTPSGDKQSRAQSIHGRIAMGKVYFPGDAHWWPEALDQLLKFPHGTHDDFVDALSHLGHGLTMQTAANPIKENTGPSLRPGTFGHMQMQVRRQQAAQARRQKRTGW
ncbi:MAG: phage terminase large subunit [Pseudomonadota bacterium]